jgi:mRNA interferase RelE/StbE
VTENDFAIAWAAPARRALARLREKAATAAVEFLCGSLAANPYRVGKPLARARRAHSARRVDYRVIYGIEDQHRRADVVAIEHRSDIYRPRQFWKPPACGNVGRASTRQRSACVAHAR